MKTFSLDKAGRMMKVLSFLFFGFLSNAFSQSDEGKIFNTLSFFYLDNSEGFESDALNKETTGYLRDIIARKNDPNSYFFFFVSGGKDFKIISNPQSATEYLDKYLRKATKESDYTLEKRAILENFTDFTVKIRTATEFNLFLSPHSINKILENADDLPLPLLLPSELLVYLNAKDLKIRVNIYSNKDGVQKIGIEKVKNCFTFCHSDLKIQKIDYNFNF